MNGVIVDIRYVKVAGRAFLDAKEMNFFKEVVIARADDIVTKWVDFFVLHKPIRPETITRRLK